MPQTTSEVWNSRWSASSRTVRPEVIDNFFEPYPTVDEYRKSGTEIVDGGGKEIEVKLEMSGGTAESFDGYDELGKAPIDPFETAFYRRRYYAVPVIISQTEEWENAGPERIFDQLGHLNKNAMKSLIKAINEDFYTAQAGKNMLGFPDIIADAAGATVGGINSTTTTAWESQRDTSAVTFLTQTVTNVFNGVDKWNDILDLCRIQGAGSGNLFTTWGIVKAYRIALSSQGYARTTVEDAGGIGGQFNPMFYDYKVIADNDCTALHSYICPKGGTNLNVLRKVNFTNTPFTSLQSNSQLAQLSYKVASVQLTTNNRRVNGVATAITGT